MCNTRYRSPDRERRLVREPAQHGVDVLADQGPVVGTADHVAPGDVEVIRELQGHGLRGEGFVNGAPLPGPRTSAIWDEKPDGRTTTSSPALKIPPATVPA